MKVCLDLFSGLGGFSEAFAESKNWHVIRIDNDEQFSKVPYTHIADIMDIGFYELEDLGALESDIVLISPPCQCFSLMAVYHYWENLRPKIQATREAIALVQKAISIKDLINPLFDVVENPNGMMKHVLGNPIAYTWWGSWYSDRDPIMKKVKLPPMKPTSLWGNLPDIRWRPKPKKGEYQEARRGAKTGIQNPTLTPEERSCIPYDFSLELMNAVERTKIIQVQETLF